MTVLVTGGCGFIGSHVCLALTCSGYEVVVADSLIGGSAESIRRVERLSGKAIKVYQCDVRDRGALSTLFAETTINAVVHCAGLKSVSESMDLPFEYYDVNLGGTAALLSEMAKAGCYKLVFSSSATVYDESCSPPYSEKVATGKASTPYGATKWAVEEMLRSGCVYGESVDVTVLRYFNPVGAHCSGQIGESPLQKPMNLLPIITEVALGRRPYLPVYGGDYNTPDGTCRRDFIHVMDLAEGHVAALRHLGGYQCFNLGTGIPISVLQMADCFEKTNNVRVPFKFESRRPGDQPDVYADASEAGLALGWSAERNLENMVRDAWNWTKHNPLGYRI